MNKFLVAGLLLFIVIAVLIWNLNRKKRGTVVLGTEMAEASEREKQRIEAGNYSTSPLPDFDYSKWTNEQSLINPKQNELDSRIIELCETFKNSKEGKRNEIRNSIDQKGIYTLLEFVKRVTIFGLRSNGPSYIDNGITAVAMIESERCDYRDVLVALSFLNYGVQKLQLDGPKMFNEAIPLSNGKTGQLIQKFSKPTEQNSIEIVGGYTPVETADGIGFIETNYEKYNPEKNLAKLLLSFSVYISGDKYTLGNITIGQKISSIWLSADNDKGVESAISKATGCASLSTYLKSEFHPKSGVQMLLLYLAEFKDQESLKVLIERTNTTSPTTFSRLSFVEGNIFCVVIQRAVMSGVEDFETNETLKRFESPIRELIKKH